MIILAVSLLLMIVAACCAASEISRAKKEKAVDPTRELVGLASIAVGNLNPAARNPGLEILCTGLYDIPGGYCTYFTSGVPFTGFSKGGNITAVHEGN